MDRLEQIKNEVAREYDFDNWKDASSYLSDDNEGNQAVAATIDVEGMVDEVARRYATEMVRHNLERAASEAYVIHTGTEKTSWQINDIIVDKQSITSLEIELI